MKCSDVKTGFLSERILIQQRTSVAKTGGGRTVTWSDVKSVWAWVKPMNATQRAMASQLEDKVTHTIIIRYDPSLKLPDKDKRIKYGTRIFVIRGLIDIEEDNRFYEINALETDEAEV